MFYRVIRQNFIAWWLDLLHDVFLYYKICILLCFITYVIFYVFIKRLKIEEFLNEILVFSLDTTVRRNEGESTTDHRWWSRFRQWTGKRERSNFLVLMFAYLRIFAYGISRNCLARDASTKRSADLRKALYEKRYDDDQSMPIQYLHICISFKR